MTNENVTSTSHHVKKDETGNKGICSWVGVALIEENMRDSCLRWFVYI